VGRKGFRSHNRFALRSKQIRFAVKADSLCGQSRFALRSKQIRFAVKRIRFAVWVLVYQQPLSFLQPCPAETAVYPVVGKRWCAKRIRSASTYG